MAPCPPCPPWWRFHSATQSNSRGPCRSCGIQHRADDLVVAGAATEIAGEPVPRFFLGRIRLRVQQRLGGDDEPRRADAALQRGMLEKLLLQRMKPLAVRDALDRRDRL